MTTIETGVCVSEIICDNSNEYIGYQTTPNPISHRREQELLNNIPPNCNEMNKAIKDIETTIKWRKRDLNPSGGFFHPNYVNHKKHIKYLQERLEKLKRYAREMGCDNC